MKHLLKGVTLFACLFLFACKKDRDLVDIDSIPTRATNFIHANFPGKKILSVKKRDYTYQNFNPNGLSVSLTISDFSKAGGPDIKVKNSSNFNYQSWSSSFNRNISGIYTVTLEGDVRLEFTFDGYYIRRLN